MKLNEVWNSGSIKHEGYVLNQHEEHEEDNIKIWHEVTSPGGKVDFLDHSPYEYITQATFAQYVAFHKKHGRFPGREDVGSRGPLHIADLERLI